MRCEDITREIATPTGRISHEQIQAHLTTCSSCSTWSNKSNQLDQLLRLTRVEEPSSQAFDALWAKTLAAVDARPSVPAAAPRVLSFTQALMTRRSFLVVTGLANAAAILLLCVTFWNRPAETVTEPLAPAPQILASVVPIVEDMTCVIRINDSGVRIDQVDMQESSGVLALNNDVPRFNDTDALNSLESMAD